MKSFFGHFGVFPFVAGLAACTSAAPNPVLDGSVLTDTPPVDRPPTDSPPPGDAPADARVPDSGTPTSAAVLSFGSDPQRTGANRNETRLTPAALRGGGFGIDMGFAPQLDGQLYSQPLYVPGVMVGGARRDVLFVATESNNVYGLDALTGEELWHTALGPTVARSRQSCGNIDTIGVTSTPVIDPATNTLYAVSFNSDVGIRFKLNALDLATGMQRAGYPAVITPPVSNGSTFDTRVTGQRGALAFRGGKVYVPFGGLYGDCGVYHGWVVSIDAATPTQQLSFATPGRGSGIWAPAGISMDAAGRIFAATGNSTPLGGSTPNSLGEFVLRIGTGASGPEFALDDMSAQFTPANARTLDIQDLDIGTVAPVVLPGTPTRVLQGGKEGMVMLLDADNLGGGTALHSGRVCTGGIFGALAGWSNGTDTYGFVPARGTRSGCSGSNGVMALRITDGGANFATAWCTASVASANPPAISSNGDADGILWVTGATTGSGGSPPVLRAYEISSGMELYANTEPPPSVRQWVPPLIADGRVYVTGADSIVMYRMR